MKKYYFLDENIFLLGEENGKVWKLPGEYNHCKPIKGILKMYICSLFCRQRNTKISKIGGNINAQNYIILLREN